MMAASAVAAAVPALAAVAGVVLAAELPSAVAVVGAVPLAVVVLLVAVAAAQELAAARERAARELVAAPAEPVVRVDCFRWAAGRTPAPRN